MSFVTTKAKAMLLSGDLDLNADDIRVIGLLNTTTVDTEEDIGFIDQYSVLGEITDGSYARKTLTGETVSQDNTNNRGEFDANDISWASLTTGGVMQGMLIYKHVTNDADSVPIAFIDSGGFPVSMTGATLNVTWNAEGIIWAANP